MLVLGEGAGVLVATAHCDLESELPVSPMIRTKLNTGGDKWYCKIIIISTKGFPLSNTMDKNALIWGCMEEQGWLQEGWRNSVSQYWQLLLASHQPETRLTHFMG